MPGSDKGIYHQYLHRDIHFTTSLLIYSLVMCEVPCQSVMSVLLEVLAIMIEVMLLMVQFHA